MTHRWLGYFVTALRSSLAARYDLVVRVVYICTISVLFFAIWWDADRTSFTSDVELATYWIGAQILFCLSQPSGLGYFTADIRSGRIFLLETRPGSHWVRLAAADLGRKTPVLILLVCVWITVISLGQVALSELSVVFLFTVSATLSFLIGFQIEFIFSASAFRLPYQVNIAELRHGLLVLLSGVLIPTENLPGMLKTIAEMTPYPYIVAWPAQSFATDPGQLPTVVIAQALWAGVLAPLSMLVEYSIRDRLETFGG